MKKIFAVSVLFSMIFHVISVFAYVEEHIEKKINYDMRYPIVYTENKFVQDKINQDIYKYIANFRNNFESGKFYDGKFNYGVVFEDNNYISIIISDSHRYGIDAFHVNNRTYGVVYDKQTGKKLKLENFLKITLYELGYMCNSNLYNMKGDKINFVNIPENKPKYISEDYCLLGGGRIAIIYQVGELSPRVDGATIIYFDLKEIEYFNRKNKNL